jgi:hypothetical protein
VKTATAATAHNIQSLILRVQSFASWRGDEAMGATVGDGELVI